MQNSGEHKRTYMDYDLIGSHARVVAVGALLVAIGLGIIGPMVANTEEPNFDPGGEIFTAVDLPSLFVDLGTEQTTANAIQGGASMQRSSPPSRRPWTARPPSLKQRPTVSPLV
jgi:hypothetical protein